MLEDERAYLSQNLWAMTLVYLFSEDAGPNPSWRTNPIGF